MMTMLPLLPLIVLAPSITEPSYHLVVRREGEFRAIEQKTFRVPNAIVRTWQICAPQPPSIELQAGVVMTCFVDGQPQVTTRSRDVARYGRGINVLSVAGVPNYEHSLPVTIVYTGTSFSTRLVEGAAKDVPEENPKELEAAKAATHCVNYTDPKFRGWLTKNNLWKSDRESQFSFALRTFRFLRSTYAYASILGASLVATDLIAMSATDCGGMSILFTGAMRANGLSSRLLAGRRLKDFTDPHDTQNHVLADVFLDGIGWVPVDVSEAVVHMDQNEERFFGSTPNPMVFFHVDCDLAFDLPGWSKPYMAPFIQWPALSVIGPHPGEATNSGEPPTWRAGIGRNAPVN